MPIKESPADIMVGFARLVSSIEAASATLPRLADALVEHAGADAVVVVAITESGVEIAELRGVDRRPPGLTIEIDEVATELGARMLAAFGAPFTHVETRHLVTEGDLFGAVVTLFRSEPADAASARLADGLVDLAALALANKAYVARLERTHADLGRSHATISRTEKVRAIGQMAAGVSHDLMNILNPLSLHVQIVERTVTLGRLDDAKASLAEMAHILKRGVETIQRLRDFSKQDVSPKREPADVNALLREAAELAHPRLTAMKSRAEIVLALGEPPVVAIVAADVLSAIVNLVVNAIDALRDRAGTITLSSGADRGGAWLSITDDGPGMPPEVKQRVLEPFFTTKGVEGTGLGLTMVNACVERHNGTLVLESEVGQGTTFRLWFPA